MAQLEALPQTQQRTPGRPGDPCIMVIFGAAGDLTRRKLIPALYNLAKAQLLSREFAIVGISHKKLSDEEYRGTTGAEIHHYAGSDVDPDICEWFTRRLYYITAEFDDKNLYQQLKAKLEKLDKDHSTHQNYFFYLATAPQFFGEIVEQLSAVGLMDESGGQHWRRVIIEKPFGHDLESAKALNQQLLSCITEHQIYRIDHYLGKETVQNILAIRFANGLFEPVWNRRYIDHVQITVAESIGIEQRGAFYEQTGAIRDMVSTHLFQMMTFLAMEPPVSFEPDRLRYETVKEFSSELMDAYETLLLEAMEGDHTLFLRQDGVERAWEVLDPILDHHGPVIPYDKGSWGPREADALIAPRKWHIAVAEDAT